MSSVKVFFPKFNLETVLEELRRVVSALSKELALEKVTLFGSYARSRYTVGSDIDLFIVFDDSRCTEDSVYKTLMRNVRLPRVEPHILSKKEYTLLKDSKWIREVEAEGIKIL